ncbi:hypothetical protein BASA62_006693 [Batrachochytrium salamandrivorans]|nr:hypothetical protein BASA62_006693 [Batrachochytrium salamandrivorans]
MLVQQVATYRAAADELSENRAGTVRTRLIKAAAHSVLHEASAKLEFAVRKELIKLAVGLIDGMRPVFQDSDDLVRVQTAIDTVTRELSISPGFDAVIKEYVEGQLQPLMMQSYSEILQTAFNAADVAIDFQIAETIDAVESFLDDPATSMSSPGRSKTSSPDPVYHAMSSISNLALTPGALVNQHQQNQPDPTMGAQPNVDQQPLLPKRSMPQIRPATQLPEKPRPKTIVSVEAEMPTIPTAVVAARPTSAYIPEEHVRSGSETLNQGPLLPARPESHLTPIVSDSLRSAPLSDLVTPRPIPHSTSTTSTASQSPSEHSAVGVPSNLSVPVMPSSQSQQQSVSPTPEKKKSGFSGFKSMLNHLTKSRPKPMRSTGKGGSPSTDISDSSCNDTPSPYGNDRMANEAYMSVTDPAIMDNAHNAAGGHFKKSEDPHVAAEHVSMATTTTTMEDSTARPMLGHSEDPYRSAQAEMNPLTTAQHSRSPSMVDSRANLHSSTGSPSLSLSTSDQPLSGADPTDTKIHLDGAMDADSANTDTISEIHGKRVIPSNAMSALASVMRASNTTRKSSDPSDDSVHAYGNPTSYENSGAPAVPMPSSSHTTESNVGSNVGPPPSVMPSVSSPPPVAPRVRPVSQLMDLARPVSMAVDAVPVANTGTAHDTLATDMHQTKDSINTSVNSTGDNVTQPPQQSNSPSAPALRPRPPVLPLPNLGDPTMISSSYHQRKSVVSVNETEVLAEGNPLHHGVDAHAVIDSDTQHHDQEANVSPRRIPGAFATNHGALGALAAAMHQRSGVNGAQAGVASLRSSHVFPTDTADQIAEVIKAGDSVDARSGVDSTSTSGVSQKDDTAQLDISDDASSSISTNPHLRNPSIGSSSPSKFGAQSTSAYLGTPMTFKRKENSISGDDKALEKRALEWMNKYLDDKAIVIDDLYTAFADSLNLIYALETRVGESVGRYSKRPMLPVHKIDNTAVALAFLNKRNVPTQFLTPQDLLDGNKGKILALFTYILKTFP